MKSYAVEGSDYVDGSWVQEETGRERDVCLVGRKTLTDVLNLNSINLSYIC